MLFPKLLEPLFPCGGIRDDLEEVLVFMQMHKVLRQSVFPVSKVRLFRIIDLVGIVVILLKEHQFLYWIMWKL